jgi:hypothetical protein
MNPFVFFHYNHLIIKLLRKSLTDPIEEITVIMPTKAYWDDPDTKTIVRIDYEGEWTWDEYFRVADEAREMALTVPHRVDYIVNLKHGKTPREGSPFSNGKTVLRRLAPNSGLVINITSAFEAVLLNIFKAFDTELGKRMVGAQSIEEARQMIARDRQRRS